MLTYALFETAFTVQLLVLLTTVKPGVRTVNTVKAIVNPGIQGSQLSEVTVPFLLYAERTNSEKLTDL